MSTLIKQKGVLEIIYRRFGFKYPQKRPYETNQYLHSYGISHKKTERRDETAKLLAKDEGYKKLVEWMNEIQKGLGETDDEFAKRFGLKSGKMIARYRRGTGNLPTEATLRELLRLERIASVRIERS